MKTIFSKIFIAAAVLLPVSCMEVDNFEEPEAHFNGRIIDETTGEVIESAQGEARVRMWEKSYSLNPANQDIPVLQDGTFRNIRLFNGTYDIVPEGPWWPADTVRVPIGRHTEAMDIKVTPYLKLIDFNANLDESGDSIVMSCRLDAPIIKGLPQIMDIRPFLSLLHFCGAGTSIASYADIPEYKKTIMQTWDKLKKDPDGKSQTYKFTVWVKHGYTYYVRMGARVKDTFQNYNYSKIIKIEIPEKK